MIEIFKAILLGIVQGITEFVPISSSGHLVLMHEWLQFEIGSPLAFDVVLHIGTLVAVVIYFRKDLVRLLRGFSWSQNYFKKLDTDQKLAWYIVASTIPAGIAGYFFNDLIETVLRSPIVVAIALSIVAVLFIVTERYSKQRKPMEKITLKSALLVGVAQAFALIPGVSRSGITMVAGMQQGLKREEAARFSFLLSVPIILGAGLKTGTDIGGEIIDTQGLILLGVGFATSAIVGYIVVAVFLRYLKKHPLDVFAYYSLILAAIVLILNV